MFQAHVVISCDQQMQAFELHEHSGARRAHRSVQRTQHPSGGALRRSRVSLPLVAWKAYTAAAYAITGWLA